MTNPDNTFNSFLLAYLGGVENLLKHGEYVNGVIDKTSIGSGFGEKTRPTLELLQYNFCVTNPRSRTFISEPYLLNKQYLLANFLWSLLGTDEANSIVKFNKHGANFLDEQGKLNSAIGPHLFKLNGSLFSEIDKIIAILKNDPSSRRAVIQLYSNKDLHSNKNDIPCYNHIQFVIREERLHCLLIMRSQNALRVLPYDFFLFSMLHEAISARMGIELGVLYHSSNSFHLYLEDIDLAKNIINNSTSEVIDCKMKAFDNETIFNLRSTYKELAKLAPNIKSNLLNKHSTKLDPYWANMLSKYM